MRRPALRSADAQRAGPAAATAARGPIRPACGPTAWSRATPDAGVGGPRATASAPIHSPPARAKVHGQVGVDEHERPSNGTTALIPLEKSATAAARCQPGRLLARDHRDDAAAPSRSAGPIPPNVPRTKRCSVACEWNASGPARPRRGVRRRAPAGQAGTRPAVGELHAGRCGCAAPCDHHDAAVVAVLDRASTGRDLRPRAHAPRSSRASGASGTGRRSSIVIRASRTRHGASTDSTLE